MTYEEKGFNNNNRVLGDIERFSGTESNSNQGLSVYQPHYSGRILGGGCNISLTNLGVHSNISPAQAR